MADNKSRKRIYDIAKEYKISSDALLKVLRGLGFTIKSHMSIASSDMLEAIDNKFKREIAEVKKDDEARKQKLQELKSKKRREEAKKLALRKKAAAQAKKKKSLAERKARKLAARELEKSQKTAELEDQKPKKMAAKKAKDEEIAEAKARKPKKAVSKRVVAEQKPRRFAKKVLEKPKTGPAKAAEPAKAEKPKAKKEKTEISRQTITSTPGAAKKLQKKLDQRIGAGRPPKKRRKRDRSKKKNEHKVDTTAVKLSFKQTMATMDSGKKIKKHKKRSQITDDDYGITAIEVTEFMTLSELARAFGKKPAELVAKCMEMGMLASINQRLDMDTIEMLAIEFELDVRQIEEVVNVTIEEEEETQLESRAPVVTIMGHVDHGKTTLLDYIRESDIVSGEAGKITQHIGAYSVQTRGGRITFLDTPGHEAFSAMRARGAQVTDVVILVISSTEAVMPQTVEAIDHAKAAKVPIMVAINKMDLPDANPDSVRQQLTNHNLLDESWGGKTIMVELSAKTGEGVDKLLEMILLQVEMLELKADPNIKAQGTVIEAQLEKGRGTVATVLIQKGTLEVGRPFVSGSYFGRVRAMADDRGNKVEKAGPSTPTIITGISGVPQAGDSFIVTSSESEARDVAQKRQQIKREYELRRVGTPTTLESIYEKIKDGQVTDLKIVIKGDVAGSVEALTETLTGIGNEEVRVNIIRSGVGAISESDVLLASASDAIVVGFHITADPRARETANREKVDIRTYSVIYEVKEDITKAIEGLLKPELVEKWKGTAEVRQPFKIPKVGLICGSHIQQGKMTRGDKIRVSRDGVVIHEGTISSLKRFKEDVKEVVAGLECGIGIEKFEDVQVGDHIETYEMVETSRTL
ncbi:MAG: translation initiation factor IF-2 [candidate division Zixibacteria bacterium]